LNEIWFVGSGRRVLHYGMPYDPIHKVKVTEVRKLQKWPISNSIYSANIRAVKKRERVV